uniref:Uncharacterized protein n=1 Tax=Romanomermis culicivorax TaxID=13658 RepID=A0A915L3D1_ROMCU
MVHLKASSSRSLVSSSEISTKRLLPPARLTPRRGPDDASTSSSNSCWSSSSSSRSSSSSSSSLYRGHKGNSMLLITNILLARVQKFCVFPDFAPSMALEIFNAGPKRTFIYRIIMSAVNSNRALPSIS